MTCLAQIGALCATHTQCSKNAANKVVFVDIAAADYNPAENAGISFERVSGPGGGGGGDAAWMVSE